MCASAIRGQERFRGKRTVVITGERAEESSNRAKYAELESHRSHLEGRRHVDQWRPILRWSEKDVWDIIERWGVNPHPAYHLGWGRLSCMTCIFGSPNQWASAKQLDPQRVQRIADYERYFGKTIDRKRSVTQMAAQGTPYKMNRKMAQVAMKTTYDEQVFLIDWKLPQGAFGESTGPT